MLQLIQVLGALAALAAFVLAQAGIFVQTSRAYLTLNLAGGAVLAALAYHERQWGFLLLEAAWTLVAAYGLVVRRSVEPARQARLRHRPPTQRPQAALPSRR